MRSVTPRELAEILSERHGRQLTQQTVQTWIHTGVNGIKLPSFLLGGMRLIDLDSFDDWQKEVAENQKRGRPRKKKVLV